MSPSFSHGKWIFDWSAAGIGPTVIFLSCSLLTGEAIALAQELERDFFVIRLRVQNAKPEDFGEAAAAFFAELQLHRVHWVITKDAADLAEHLLKELPQVVWSMTAEETTLDHPKVKAIVRIAPDFETALRQEFARVDPPYRTSEHPI